MPAPSFASTRLLNPPGVLPVLTISQIWAGLSLKARDPMSFVKAITSCEVVSDDGAGKMERRVRFGADGPVATELLSCYANTCVYFEHSLGYRILNIVSYNESNELCITYAFCNGIPAVGDRDPTKMSDVELNEVVGKGVEMSVKRIRELVVEGRIK